MSTLARQFSLMCHNNQPATMTEPTEAATPHVVEASTSGDDANSPPATSLSSTTKRTSNYDDDEEEEACAPSTY
jgi:hypothetical protein